MMLDADLIRTRCTEIDESITRLDAIGQLPRERFLADADFRDIACYRLLVAIESALALCYHVSARRLKKAPDDYAACFAVLADHDLVPRALSTRLQKMARFRNLLVHVYWKLDYNQVYDVIRRDLGDLREFSSIVSGLV